MTEVDKSPEAILGLPEAASAALSLSKRRVLCPAPDSMAKEEVRALVELMEGLPSQGQVRPQP